MKAKDRRVLSERKARIDERLNSPPEWRLRPMIGGANVSYEVASRVTAVFCGGIGLVHAFVRALGLPEAIDRHLQIFERHFPYFESDHVLNLTYNIVAGGTCLEDIEKLRQDEAYLTILGAERIPDPTTAGDFLRRFDFEHVFALMDAFDEVRLEVWQKLPPAQRELARVDVDGTITETTGECKQGIGGPCIPSTARSSFSRASFQTVLAVFPHTAYRRGLGPEHYAIPRNAGAGYCTVPRRRWSPRLTKKSEVQVAASPTRRFRPLRFIKKRFRRHQT